MGEDFINHFIFNIEITSDRFALVDMQKKPSERSKNTHVVGGSR